MFYRNFYLGRIKSRRKLDEKLIEEILNEIN